MPLILIYADIWISNSSYHRNCFKFFQKYITENQFIAIIRSFFNENQMISNLNMIWGGAWNHLYWHSLYALYNHRHRFVRIQKNIVMQEHNLQMRGSIFVMGERDKVKTRSFCVVYDSSNWGWTLSRGNDLFPHIH